MKKLLHKSCQWLVMLITMFAVSFSANAQDVTITPGYNASTMTSGDVTVSGTGSYMSGYGYLVQGNQNMVVTSSGKAIVKIVVTENSNYRSYNYWDVSVGELTSTVGSKDAPVWEGNAQSVTFSNKSNPQEWEMYGVSKIEVWFEGGAVTPDPGTGGGTVTPDPGTGGTVTPDPGTGGGTTGAGGVLNFDFSAGGSGSLTQSPVTVTYSRSSEAGKSVASLSMFDNPLVFTSTGANIVKIEFTGKNLNLVNASLDGYNNPVWEGSAKSVTFNVNGGWSDYAIVSTAIVTLEGTAPDPGTDPVDPGTGTDPVDPGTAKPSFPAEGVAYQLQVVGESLYLNLQKHATAAAVLGTKAEAIYFTWDETNKAFTVKDADGNYAGVATANAWHMSSATPDYWNVEQDGNAYYLKNTAGKYLGCNNYEAGYSFFRDKTKGDADKFVITEYVEQQIEYTYFSIPDEAFHKSSIDMDDGQGHTISQLTFNLYASEISGVDKFEPIAGNGKSVSAYVQVTGGQGRNVNLTFSSYDGSYISISNLPSTVTDGQTAFTIKFPRGAFVAANGDVSGEFTFTYTPGVVRKTYTINLYDGYSAYTPVKAPADVYVVYANEPNGTQYKNGSSYSTTSEVSEYDFACPLKYWEIDREHSRVGESTIFLYLNRLPYNYHVTIDGCENATVTVKGEQYGNGATIVTTDLLTESDVVFDNNVRGYTLQKQNYTAPNGDEDGYITAYYDVFQYTYATLNTGRTNPAPGTYSLDDRDYGFQYFSVYFNETMSQDVSIATADLASAGITLRDAEGRDIEFGDNGVNAWADGQYFNFSAKEAITTPGTYTLHVPAGTFFFGEKQEMTNSELNLTWTLTAAQYFDVRDNATPTGTKNADESQLLTLQGFEMKLTGAQVANTGNLINKLYQVADGAYRVDLDDPTTYVELTDMVDFVSLIKDGLLQISFTHEYKPKAPTYYTFMVPQGSFTSTDGLKNKAFQLSAHVDPTTYFDYTVTYPTADNAVGPVAHITVELPGSPAGMPALAEDGSIYVNGHEYATSELQFGVNAAGEYVINLPQAAIVPVGSMFNYNIPTGTVIYYDIDSKRTISVGRSKSEYNIPVTAAPVEYYVHFEGWPFETHGPSVTYNGQSYHEKEDISAADLTVDQLSATDAPGYEYTITIEETGTPRILVTYTKALNLVAVELNVFSNADGKNGVSSAVAYPTTDGANIWNADDPQYGVIKVSSKRPIRKVELTVSQNAADVFERGQQGEFSVSGNVATWTGNSNALVFASASDIIVTKLVAYYDADAEVAVDNSVALAKAVGGDVNEISKYVSLDFASNFVATHSAYNGQTDIPEGVKFCRVNRDGSETEVTISEFNYWAATPNLSVVLEKSISTPGVYHLTIPAGTLEFEQGKGNEAINVDWTIFNFGFSDYEVAGNVVAEDPMQQKIKRISGFTLGLDEETGIVLSEYTGSETANVYLVGEDGEETAIATTPHVSTKTNRLELPFGENDVITEAGRYTFRIPAGMVSETGGFPNREYIINVTVDPYDHFYLTNKFGKEMGGYVAKFSDYCITSTDAGWTEYMANATDADEAALVGKTFDLNYWDSEAGQRVEQNIEVKEVHFVDDYIYLGFDTVTVPFDTEFSFSFPQGFITSGNNVSYPTTIGGHIFAKVYGYDVKYDESVPEGAFLYMNDVLVADGASYGSREPKDPSEFTATPVPGMNAVITIVQPTEEQEGSITLSYETIESMAWDGRYSYNGLPSNLGDDLYSSLTTITIPAPEGHTFTSANNCVLYVSGLEGDYKPYKSVESTISADGSEVTLTLKPGYSKPGYVALYLAYGSLILDNDTPYDGFNLGITIYPEYAFRIDHSDPADGSAIYNGELNSIDLYLPDGLSVGTNAELEIEVIGTDYVENFLPAYAYGVNGQYVHVQLPTSMDLPTGDLWITIPAGMMFYYDYENGDRLTVNAPYSVRLTNYSALQLVTEPAAGTVVGLDAIRVKGERGTLWSPNTDAETLAQSVHFGTYESPVAVNTTIENGVLVVTPTETLAEGYYTLTIDGLAGILESADVAASVNAPARFEFNIVASTFAFQYAQPYNNTVIDDLQAMEDITVSIPWDVEDLQITDPEALIKVTFVDGTGEKLDLVTLSPSLEAGQYGYSVKLKGSMTSGFTFILTDDDKYNISLTIPAGLFVSSNGRSNEEMTLNYVFDRNIYFAVEPNFEHWGHITGPVKTFTLTAPEGFTITGIAPDKVADPENGVDRPTIFKNGSYLTWANPVISADGKSVTLTLAEPISADSPYDQYFLVVPDGLFTGKDNADWDATSTGFDAWQKVFYVDAPAYEYAQINWGDEMQSGDSYAGKASNFQIHFGKSVYCGNEVPAGAVLTDDQGTSYALASMWSSDDYIFLSSDEISAPGHYTLILPAGAGWFDGEVATQEVRFEFNIVGSFAITDGTFSPADNAKVDAPFVSFTYTLPEGKTVQSVDVTKVGTSELNSNWGWDFTPFAGLTYEIAGEKNQVVFTFAQPFTEAGSVAIKILDGAIVAADGSVSTTNPSPQSTFSVQVVKYTYNDITEDGVNDTDDAIAISEIILQIEENNLKADVNGDDKVTIGDLVKYIQKLQKDNK